MWSVLCCGGMSSLLMFVICVDVVVSCSEVHRGAAASLSRLRRPQPDRRVSHRARLQPRPISVPTFPVPWYTPGTTFNRPGVPFTKAHISSAYCHRRGAGRYSCRTHGDVAEAGRVGFARATNVPKRGAGVRRMMLA